MTPYTYQDLIRKYSADVAKGTFDTDLTPRERRLTAVLLNLASNAPIAQVYYPPIDSTRDIVVQHMADIVWQARPIVEAVSPAYMTQFECAVDRAISILRGI